MSAARGGALIADGLSNGLRLESVTVRYGQAVAVDGVTFDVPQGAAVALLGRNGAGKSSTLRAIAGLNPVAGGRVFWDGGVLTGRPAHRIARAGVALTPENRGVLPSLSVVEQLDLAMAAPNDRPCGPAFGLDEAFALFPRLRARRDHGGGALSGGEQQMLAIARALARRPGLLLLDEPTEGLAPRVAEEVAAALRAMATPGRAIVLVERRLDFAAALTEHAVVLSKGVVSWRGRTAALADDAAARRRWLGVG